MTSGAEWNGNQLFLGRVLIGRVEPRARENPKHVLALSYLPGAAHVIGWHLSEPEAQLMVERSANSRMMAMLGGSIEDVATSVASARELRKLGRAIYRAGIWTCDRPAYAQAMFSALGRALRLPPSEAPTPIDGKAYDTDSGQCSAFEIPEDDQMTA